MTLHEGEVATDAELVARLVAEQLPRLTGLPVTAVPCVGTVNAVYRLGDRLCVRLPRLQAWVQDLERELRWLPELAPRLPLAVPEVVARGRPSGGYPFPWAVYGWLEGAPYDDALVDDERRAAQDLAAFVRELRGTVPVEGAPPAGRPPLRCLDEPTRGSVAEAAGALDARAVGRAWDRALDAPAWDGAPVWVHADLLRPNLLVRRGRLCGVLDFGGAGAGDPAADVIAAWSVFGRQGRAAYRAALDVDDGTWERARGYALSQAVAIVPYYATTNPAFVRTALRTVAEVLVDVRAGS